MKTSDPNPKAQVISICDIFTTIEAMKTFFTILVVAASAERRLEDEDVGPEPERAEATPQNHRQMGNMMANFIPGMDQIMDSMPGFFGTTQAPANGSSQSEAADP